MKTSTNVKVKEYDLVRGIAILLVVLGHSYQMGTASISMEGVVSLETNGVAHFFNYVINEIIYSFHMPLYMILSGALAYKAFERWEIAVYFKTRFGRLIIPFVLCGFLFSVPIKFICGYFGTCSLAESYINSLILMKTTGHLWFLFVLFILDGLFIVAYKREITRTPLFLFLLVGLFLVHDYLPADGLMLYRICHFALYFYLGLMFEKKGIRKRICELDAKKKKVLVVVCLVIYGISYGMEQFSSEIIPIGKAPVRNVFEFFQAVSASAAIFMLCHLIASKEHKFINYLSERSFGIYLYHEPIIIFCIWLFMNTEFAMLMSTEMGYLLSIVLRFVIGLVGALAVNYFVKKFIILLNLRGKSVKE